MSTANERWGQRLKQARLAADMSQKQLGMAAGIDEFAASPRINRYELGIHKADLLTAQNLARVLDIPVAFLYADEDEIAMLIYQYSRSSKSDQRAVRQIIEKVGGLKL